MRREKMTNKDFFTMMGLARRRCFGSRNLIYSYLLLTASIRIVSSFVNTPRQLRHHQPWIAAKTDTGIASTTKSAMIGPNIVSLSKDAGTTLFQRVGKPVLAVMGTVALLSIFLYGFHRGFRRTVDFWIGVAPMIAEYKFLKFKCRASQRGPKSILFRRTTNKDNEDTIICTSNDEQWKAIMSDYHERTAPKIVKLILRLGGIYVKVGQFFSAIGGGILDDTYVRALQPLQSGVPPRSISEISNIIERSVGRPMDSIFHTFDETPIGAASIAQAHRATLARRTDKDYFEHNHNNSIAVNSTTQTLTEVVVKVQYPEVAELLQADFQNLMLATRFLNPDNIPAVKALKERHQNELDFRLEAEQLHECRSNMQRHGLEPYIIRIPHVVDEYTSQHVLVMEYLEGTSLAKAMDDELTDIALALGHESAHSLRRKIQNDLKQHMLDGGGHANLIEDKEVRNEGARKSGRLPAADIMGITQTVAPMIRAYASLFRRVRNVNTNVRNGVSRTLEAVTGGRIQPTYVELENHGNSRQSKIDLGKVIKTLVMVHGFQVIMDGVYNADPHPGNVLILPDGRIGLIDYGMVGRLNEDEQELIASTVLAFTTGDDDTVIRNYLDTGYRIGWSSTSEEFEGDHTNHPDNIIHRCARFHLDRIDLSPVTMNDRTIPVFQLLQKSIERAVPDWIEQMKRIGGLLMGVASQAGRPISLSKEWTPIARQYLKEKGAGTMRSKNRKGPTQLAEKGKRVIASQDQ